ncbi:MAG: hypothetical protein DRQ51_00980 [Gammaproteobacteria bacterium]|nr:MAG: hypothetical protein DRQ51_00980 [Gammaproteobacteria bacterium]
MIKQTPQYRLKYYTVIFLCLLWQNTDAEIIVQKYGVDANVNQRFNSNMERRLSIPIKKLLGNNSFIVQVDANLKNVQKTKVINLPSKPVNNNTYHPALDLYINDQFAPKINQKYSPVYPGINSMDSINKTESNHIYDSLQMGSEPDNVIDFPNPNIVDNNGSFSQNMLLPGIQITNSSKYNLSPQQNRQLQTYQKYQKAQALQRINKLRQKTKKNYKLIGTSIKVDRLKINVLIDENVDFEKEEIIRNLIITQTNLSFDRGDSLELIRTTFPNAIDNNKHKNQQNANARYRQNYLQPTIAPVPSQQYPPQPIVLPQPQPQPQPQIQIDRQNYQPSLFDYSGITSLQFFDIKNFLIDYWWSGILLLVFIIYYFNKKSSQRRFNNDDYFYNFANSQATPDLLIHRSQPQIIAEPQTKIINPQQKPPYQKTSSQRERSLVKEYHGNSNGHDRKTTEALNKLKESVYKDELVNLIISQPANFTEQIQEWINSNSKQAKKYIITAYALLGEGIFNGVFNKLSDDDKASLNNAVLEYKKSTSNSDFQRHSRELYRLFSCNIMSRPNNASGLSMPFAFLEKMNNSHIKYLIENENYKIKALVLSQLNSKKAAQIISDYEDRERSLIAIEISNFRELPIATFRQIATRLAKQSKKIPSFNNVLVDGVELLVNMLGQLDEGREKMILNSIKSYDPNLFFKIKQHYLNFNDLTKLPNIALKNLIGAVDRRMLATALSGADGDIVQRFLQVLSETSANALKYTLKQIGNPSSDETLKAKQLISSQARHMLKSGLLKNPVV